MEGAAINYFEFYPGDYRRDTSHLPLAEHGAYLMLMMAYYSTETPLPADSSALYRIAGAMTAGEQKAVRSVADQFFPVGEDGLRHSRRIDSEITKAAGRMEGQAERRANEADRQRRTRARRAQMFAELREAGITPDGLITMDELRALHEANVTAASRVTSRDCHCQVTPVNTATRPQTPYTKDQEQPSSDDEGVAGKPAPPTCPQSEIVALYHEVLPELARVRDWTPDRQAFLRARWREDPERQTVEWWRGFFEYVRKCPFLMGQGAASADRDPFFADLEWLVRPKNFRKVIEGKYERRRA